MTFFAHLGAVLTAALNAAASRDERLVNQPTEVATPDTTTRSLEVKKRKRRSRKTIQEQQMSAMNIPSQSHIVTRSRPSSSGSSFSGSNSSAMDNHNASGINIMDNFQQDQSSLLETSQSPVDVKKMTREERKVHEVWKLIEKMEKKQKKKDLRSEKKRMKYAKNGEVHD